MFQDVFQISTLYPNDPHIFMNVNPSPQFKHVNFPYNHYRGEGMKGYVTLVLK